MTTETLQAPAPVYKPSILNIATQIRRKGMLGFFMDAWKTYGDLAHLRLGPQEVFLIIHPDHVRYVNVTHGQNFDKLETYDPVRELMLGDGLVASTGDLWRRQRRLMAPFFTPRGIESYHPVIVQDTLSFIERWEQLAREKISVDMTDEMMLITAAIILHTVFTTESNDDMLSIKDAVETMIQFTATSQMNPLHPPLWVPTPQNRKYGRSRNIVHDYIDDLIAQRRALPEDAWPNDLLSKLMLARDADTGEAMSDKLLRDEAITLFFAGHETTARTMTFLWYSLDQNPDVEARLHDEIDRVVGDRSPTIDDLKRLPYTLQVIKETLRLYPAAPMYARDVVADDEIGGVRIPAGARVMPMPFATHRHPDFWEDPERFDPDRWEPERERQRHPHAFHPFAGGQRICLGNNFSLFETQVLTAMLARRFRARLAPNYQLRIDMKGTISVENGMPMTIERRANG